ncbi:hypothetical protein F909_02198 [Acinetobacter sp. ANC 3929]|uniref:hypothetical protein n=1 Tax=unclassified Acinetobacter TaxID=196816 RepID=UPI0002CF2233|nr:MULTISPECIES: hypothetical protein [unclassified Acinetobacter]ENW80908.1 hypothetical protein F909_02198 [Acinetobacter sp. ANC 3929]MCH7353098.1 hypothetical protein [Acinetobacter sp. NIPH 2023]MCH7356932.1 hypothetical protein [Acinetobacter sp. NIPH 1958]MCH7360399.1 hypothetical protein [Acinetobacter sp. NIPH 2024]
MTELINKGGFRERANRSRKYKQSENEITTLRSSQYQPQNKEVDKQKPNSEQIANQQEQNDQT